MSMEEVNFGSIPPSLLPDSPRNRVMNHGSLTPPPYHQTLDQRMLKDTCFHCKIQGHWAKDCPSKTPKRSRPSCPNSPNFSDHPVILCRCGSVCSVQVSKTDKNPNRKFYSCPTKQPGNGCGFFKWCDEVCSPESIVPLCPCGAGRCSVHIMTTGENAGRTYFACRVKKGHGACKFMQWEDSHVDTIINAHVDESRHNSPLPFKWKSCRVNDTANSELGSEVDLNFDRQKRMKFEVSITKRQKVHEGMSETSTQTEYNSQSIQTVATYSSRLNSPSKVHRRQEELWRQISAAGDTSLGDSLQISGIQVPDWLARLVFTPLQTLIVPPPMPFYCGVFPSLDYVSVSKNTIMFDIRGSNFLTRIPNIKSNNPCPQNRELLHARGPIVSLHRNVITKAMLEASELDELTGQASNHSRIESSINVELASQDLIDQYNSEKVKLDYISRIHREATSSFSSFDKQLPVLRKQASHVKNILVEIENQLSYCELEASKLKTRVDELSKEMLESEKSLQSAETALELHFQKETGQCQGEDSA